jgi:CRP/FNR family transcriptional regulator
MSRSTRLHERTFGDQEALENFLEKVILLRGLTKENIRYLCAIAEQKAFTKGETARGLFVLVKGKVKIYKLSPNGKEQVLHFIKPGDAFGEVVAFLGTSFRAYAEVLEESRVFSISREAVYSLWYLQRW